MFPCEESAFFFTFLVSTWLVPTLTKNCDMTMYDPNGSFSSHTSGDNYNNNMDCEFRIEVPDGFAVKLTWKSFDIKGQMPLCTKHDYVEVFIGCNSQTIGRFCSDNSEFPHDIFSPDKCLKIIFHTNEDQNTGKGFKAMYESVDLKTALSSSTGCGRTDLQGSSGIMYSPRWPLTYPPTKECTWEINVGAGNNLKISFMELNLQTSSFCGIHDDHIEIRGSKEGGQYYTASKVQDRVCGKRMAFYLTTTYEKVFVRFKSDSFTEARGFIAGYVVYHPEKNNGIFMISIVIGVLVFLAVLACCIGVCCFYRRQSRKRKRRSSRRARAQLAHQEQQSTDSSEPAVQQANTSIPAPITGPPPPYTVTPDHTPVYPLQDYSSSPIYPPVYPGPSSTPSVDPAYPSHLGLSNTPSSEHTPPYPVNGHSYRPPLVDPPPYSTLPRPL